MKHNLKAVEIFESVFLLSLFLLWLICFLALDDSPLLNLQQNSPSSHHTHHSLSSHLNLLEVFEGPEAPDEPEEPDHSPGHAHVVEALGDCLALAPGRLAAVHSLGAVTVILRPGGAQHRVVTGDGEGVGQGGLGVRDTDPGK